MFIMYSMSSLLMDSICSGSNNSIFNLKINQLTKYQTSLYYSNMFPLISLMSSSLSPFSMPPSLSILAFPVSAIFPISSSICNMTLFTPILETFPFYAFFQFYYTHMHICIHPQTRTQGGSAQGKRKRVKMHYLVFCLWVT